MASSRVFGAVRRFSTSSVAQNQVVKAPIQVFGVEGRYAHAIYSAASKEKNLEAVEKELSGIQNLMKKDANFKEFINNPAVPKSEKKSILQEILNSQKCSKITVNLFDAMVDNGRMSRTYSIINAFSQIMSAHRGEVLCTVTTAKALDASQLKELQASLKLFAKKGEAIQLETVVDPDIIGGMVVSIGDRFVDMSMASKIKTYTNLIKQAV